MVRIFAKQNSTERVAKYITNRDDIRDHMRCLNQNNPGSNWVYVADLDFDEAIMFQSSHQYQGFDSTVTDYNKDAVFKMSIV